MKLHPLVEVLERKLEKYTEEELVEKCKFSVKAIDWNDKESIFLDYENEFFALGMMGSAMRATAAKRMLDAGKTPGTVEWRGAFGGSGLRVQFDSIDEDDRIEVFQQVALSRFPFCYGLNIATGEISNDEIMDHPIKIDEGISYDKCKVFFVVAETMRNVIKEAKLVRNEMKCVPPE